MKRKMLWMAGVVALLFSAGIGSASQVSLVDVTKSESIRWVDFNTKISGMAYSHYSTEAGFVVKASFNNLPDPEGEDFYEGWAVRKEPFAFISTGKVTKNASGKYTNEFYSETDYRGYDFYVLTLEPNDNNPAPADHIIEGDMKLLSIDEYEKMSQKEDKIMSKWEMHHDKEMMKDSMMKKPDMMKSGITDDTLVMKKKMTKQKMMKKKYYSRVNAIFQKYDKDQLMIIAGKIQKIREHYEENTEISETKKSKIFEILDTVDFVLSEKIEMMWE